MVRLQVNLEEYTVHFVPQVLLTYNFVPPGTNIYIQLEGIFFSCWMSDHSYRTQSGGRADWVLSSVYPEYGYGLLPRFRAFPDMIYSLRQATVLELACPEKVLGKAALLIFSMCFPTFIYMVF